MSHPSTKSGSHFCAVYGHAFNQISALPGKRWRDTRAPRFAHECGQKAGIKQERCDPGVCALLLGERAVMEGRSRS